jgi:hypothetical protein
LTGSGTAQRQAREKLLEAARRREIDVVLVWRLDRWGRSVTDLLATLHELEGGLVRRPVLSGLLEHRPIYVLARGIPVDGGVVDFAWILDGVGKIAEDDV